MDQNNFVKFKQLDQNIQQITKSVESPNKDREK